MTVGELMNPMPAVRYKLVHNLSGLYLHDRQTGTLTQWCSHPVQGIQNICIDSVEYVLGDDGESLFPVTPEGGIFRL